MKKFYAFILSTIFVLFAYSCNDKLDIINNEDSSLNREELVFKDLKFLPLEKQGSLRSSGNNNKDDGLNIVVVKVEFGRKKYGCNRGFGVCNVVWFPDFNSLAVQPDDYRSVFAYLKENTENGEHYIELPLAEEPNPEFSVEDLTLKVDSPLEFISNGEDSLGESYIALSKGYKLDPKVGEHGGYKIELLPNP